jgi:RNA polymerase sigma factor (sigma-70 family)
MEHLAARCLLKRKEPYTMDKNYNYNGYQQYYREIQHYPLLTHEKVCELAKQYQEGNEAAGQQIIQANLKFVVRVSRKYFYCGHNCLDIIQEGNLGLIKALHRFDPGRGIPFIYYAVWWIKAFIMAFMSRSGKVHTGSLSHAKKLLSLDEYLGNDDHDKVRRVDFLTDGNDPEKMFHGKETSSNASCLLDHCFTFLSDREVAVLKQRYFSDPPVKLKEIGAQFGVSRERVRQIQVRSIEKLKQALEDQVSSFSVSNTTEPYSFTGNSLSLFIHKGGYQN